MQFVQCESCGKRVEKSQAKTFQDKEWFEHYACNDNHLLRAMIAYEKAFKVRETFVLAFES